jgi:hypothetical protein
MHDGARKRAFGLEAQQKWPDEGMGMIVIETSWGPTIHWVEPKGKGSLPVKRAMAKCPTCKKGVEAGHLGQHMSIHE